MDIHDTSRSAEHGAHSIGHRDPLDDDCMDSRAVRPFRSHSGPLMEGGICHVAGKIAQEDGLHAPRAGTGRVGRSPAGTGAAHSMVPHTGSGALRPR